MDFYLHNYPKASKSHTCEMCKRTIEKGKTYSYEKGMNNGQFFVRKLCKGCENILNNYCLENGWGEFEWNWITEWLHDNCCCDCKHHDNCKNKKNIFQCQIIRRNYGKKLNINDRR